MKASVADVCSGKMCDVLVLCGFKGAARSGYVRRIESCSWNKAGIAECEDELLIVCYIADIQMRG